ncbi:MAG: hydrolase TatD [Treponema sp.]|nr:MAG: hydrolase TatD [Treponema sp.]
MYTDSHIHIDELFKVCRGFDDQNSNIMPNKDLAFCSSSNTKEGFNFTRRFCKEYNLDRAFFSFGIHPQNPDKKNLVFLEKLCVEKKLTAIGEIGFDLFTEDFRKTLHLQKAVWSEQVWLAVKHGLPIIVHSRKAMPVFFENIDTLKRVPAVIFHGWSGSILEARSFLKKGVNAFFSIGKNLLRKQKRAIAMVTDFELTRLLTETDAPFMTLKNEQFTKSADIRAVVRSFADYRQMDGNVLAQNIADNFFKAFSV